MQPILNSATATFKALGDPTRQRILQLLTQREMTIGELADHFEMTRVGVRKHLGLLEAGNLVRIETRGRERVSSINPNGFREVVSWVSMFEQFWDEKLLALKAAIEEDNL